MSADQERLINQRNNVIIGKGSMSEKSLCNIKRCNKHDKYLLFVGDSCRLSTLFGCCCAKHLPLMIDKAFEEREKDIKKQINRMKQREIEEAKKILDNHKIA